MNKFLYRLPSLIFNVAETLAIILIGFSLELDWFEIITILLTFAITRVLTKSAMHYKSWKLCLIWSSLQLFSLFLTVKVNLFIGISFTIFAGIILSGKGNIDDIFQWGGNRLNTEVFDWVKFNQDNEKIDRI